jgi:protocatechuate 3,4-dioxygenase beta subunit
MSGRARGSVLRLVAIALVVVALGVIAWRWTARRQTAPPATSSAGSAPAGAAQAPSRPAGAARARERPIRLTQATAERETKDPQGAFEGRVLSWATGEGIAGAELTFEHAGATSSVKTGAEGAFRFEPREAGVYRLALATAASYLPYAPEWGHSPISLSARSGERIRDITVYLFPAVTYVGVVRDPGGAPVAGASVQLLDPGSGGAAPAQAAERLVTDAAGEVRLVAADDALLEARHPSFSPARARVDFRAQASGRVVLRLGAKGDAPPAEETIEGRVVDARGDGVSGALVRAAYADDPPHLEQLRPSPAAIAEADGRFVIEGLDPGRYDVRALAPPDVGLAPAEVEGVSSGARGLVLTLASAGGKVRGTVRDGATGEPVAAFTVLVTVRVGPLQRRLYASAGVFDASGRYEVAGLVPGAYAVTVAAHGLAPAADVEFRIADPPGEAETVDFALTRGGRVTGTVLDEATGAPIEGARVSVEGHLGSDGDLPLLASATSDASGEFAVGGLQAGLRSITILAAGHHGRILSGLNVPEGGDLGPITVKLRPTEEGEEPRLELTGIGAVLSAKGDALVIGEVMEGGGAREAGLVADDAIVAIERQPVTEVGFEGSVQRIRGPEGSSVLLTVRKAAGGEPLEIAVFRRRIGR